MRVTKKMKKMAKLVWENRNEGMHAWYPYRNKYITIEADEDGGEDYVLIGKVKKIDVLGYPISEFDDYVVLEEKDFENKKEKEKC